MNHFVEEGDFGRTDERQTRVISLPPHYYMSDFQETQRTYTKKNDKEDNNIYTVLLCVRFL